MKITIEIDHQTGELLSLALEKQIAKSAGERDEFGRTGYLNMHGLAARDVAWLKGVHDQLAEAMYPPDPDCPDPPDDANALHPRVTDLIEDAEGWANYTREHPSDDTRESRTVLEEEARAAELAAGWDATP